MNQLSVQSQVASGVCLASPPTHSMNIEGYLNRAKAFTQLKEYSRAIVELRQAIKEYPNNAVCHSRLSVIYFESGQKTMARVHARRSLELDPSNQLSTKIQQKLMKHHIKKRAVNKTGIMGLLPRKLF
ncbi:MAG: tetratricopeptide repeat protein [Cyanobacteria bacterium J06642_11]